MLYEKSAIPLISIILPVFNAERTISRCIKSVLDQTLSNFELIIINDGSRDSTLNICKYFESKSNQIKILCQENKGVSSARNKGIEISLGKYICFIDADDWIDTRYLAAFFEKEPDRREIVFQDCIEESDNVSSIKCYFSNKRYNRTELGNCVDEQKLLNYGYPFCKLYRKDVIEKYRIRFNENIFFIEDRIFLLEYLQYIDYFRFTDNAFYHYTFEDEQQQSLTFKHNSYESEINAYFIEKDLLNKLFKQFSFNNETIQYCKSCNGFLLYRAMRTMYRPEWRKPFRDRLKILRKLYTQENTYCLDKYARIYLSESLNRISVYLYVHNFLYTYDIYIRFFIFIRYNLSIVWRVFRKAVKPIKT